jgi:hypothetical protein
MRPRKILKLFVFLSVAFHWKPALSQGAGTGLSIEISTFQDVVPSGFPVKVKAEVTNTSSRAIRCSEAGLEFEIEVRDTAGTLLQTTEKYRESLRKPALRRLTIEVAPGETRKWVFVLSDMYDLSNLGQYSVQIRWPGGGEYVYSPAVSNIISVKIATATTAAPQNLAGPKASFSLEIDAPQDVLKSDSPINIVILATNATDHVLDLDNSPNLYSIEVRDQSQMEPAVAEAGKLLQRLHGKGSGNQLRLKPGEVVGLGTLQISDLYDFRQPGEYTIQIARIDEETRTLVKSNTVSVTLKPRSKRSRTSSPSPRRSVD